MAKGLMLVFSKPVSEGREDAYNRWYDERHLEEVASVGGFVSGTRYRIADHQLREGHNVQGLPYLAAYEIEADDIQTAVENLRRARPGIYREPDTLDDDSLLTVIFEEITPTIRTGPSTETS